MGKHGTGKIERKCKVCSIEFLARRDRPGYFCSKVCQISGRKKKDRVYIEYECKKCLSKFRRRKGFSGTHEFCSRSCLAKAKLVGIFKIMPSGENHVNWKGGISERPYQVRKKIKEIISLQGKCNKCGSMSLLQGHHIKPYSEFPELGCDENNIVILCISCHALQHPEISSFIFKGDKYGRDVDK